MDGRFVSKDQLGQIKWFKTKGDRHNDPYDLNHLDLNAVVIIGKSFDVDQKLILLNMTTLFHLFNRP